MATPPAGWNNINLNKPNEYSSEFAIDGLRYANVTNTSTGQRQLFLVSGLGGTPFTQRTPLTTTNSDGTVIKGEGFDDFVRNYGQGKLTNAEITNRRQSNFLISQVATPQEKAALAGTSQYKGVLGNTEQTPPAAGTNPAAAGGTNAGTAGATTTLTKEELEARATAAKEAVTRDVNSEEGDDLRYPINNSYQGDYIQIEMRTYQKSGFQSEEGSLTVTRMEDRKHKKLRTIYLPIQSGIVDSISVDWGNGELNPITAQFANLAMGTIIEAGKNDPLSAAGKFVNNFAAIGEKFLGPNATPDMQKLVANYFTEQAIGQPGLLSRSIGGAINNNLELLFNGPTLRSFTFNFKLTPREPQEADVIKQIIRVFKKGMSPALSKSGLFLSAPNVFKIKYFYTGNAGGDEPHPYLNRIKVAALRDFSVNYTPDGNYMTYGGKSQGAGSMTQYDLSMTFGEIDPVYAQDYDEEQGKTGMGW